MRQTQFLQAVVGARFSAQRFGLVRDRFQIQQCARRNACHQRWTQCPGSRCAAQQCASQNRHARGHRQRLRTILRLPLILNPTSHEH